MCRGGFVVSRNAIYETKIYKGDAYMTLFIYNHVSSIDLERLGLSYSFSKAI
jgi:hypothetical protein